MARTGAQPLTTVDTRVEKPNATGNQPSLFGSQHVSWYCGAYRSVRDSLENGLYIPQLVRQSHLVETWAVNVSWQMQHRLSG